MAISRSKKESIVAQVKDFFQTSKLTVLLNYEGMSVVQLQALRQELKGANVVAKVIKNRLLQRALAELDTFKNLSTDLQGMIICVFSFDDEVKGAQIVQKFIQKFQAPLAFVGGITADGQMMDQATVIKLAGLSSRPVLLGRLVNTLQSPCHQLQTGLCNNLVRMLQSLQARTS